MKKSRTSVLMQSQIENAMRVTRSNRSAAEYLRVSYNLYKKFASYYKNSEGVTLFNAHKNQQGSGIPKTHAADKRRFKLDDILLGKHPQYPREKLLKRLIVNGNKEEKCNSCGYCTKRPTDFRSPIVLHHVNGNKTDHRLDNLELLCFNCYFTQVGNLSSRDLKITSAERTEVRSTEEALQSGADMNMFDILTEEEKLDMIKKLGEI
jgi:hypothetical protein